MKRILLSAALLAVAGLSSFAEYIDTNGKVEFFGEYDQAYYPGIVYYILDDEAKTVAIAGTNQSDSNPNCPHGDFVVPSIVEADFVWYNPTTGQNEVHPKS
ncbi:MAG: hypothetical protein NC301_09105 [Bacteroides sp.]|nr:hypothetical protein [Alistipes timonensis]MCM1311159.1 hypothetical protein [Bacteroides sp.]MCM1406063.1 hypothetical protein [[Clostridium] fimetarium]